MNESILNAVPVFVSSFSSFMLIFSVIKWHSCSLTRDVHVLVVMLISNPMLVFVFVFVFFGRSGIRLSANTSGEFYQRQFLNFVAASKYKTSKGLYCCLL